MNLVTEIPEIRGLMVISLDGSAALRVRKSHFAKVPLSVGDEVEPEEYQNNPRQWTPPAPAPSPAPPAPVRTPPAPAENQTVSTGAYFGLMLLFALPVVGFISCIILSFAPQNPNLKHFARANLIWAIIGLVLGTILVGGLFLLGGTVLQQLEMTGEQLPLWEELLGGYGIP